MVNLKWGSLDTRAVFLGWNRKEAPWRCSYLLELPERGLSTGRDGVLFFSLADSKDKPSSYKDEAGEDKGKKAKEAAKEEDDSKKKREAIDLTLGMTDRTGNMARLPLSHYWKLQPQVEADVVKASFLTDVPTSEIVYQTLEFPLADFFAANPRLDPAALRSLHLVFDRTVKGVVIPDGIGFRQGGK